MRLPPNLKYFLFFLLFSGIIVLGVFYLPRLVPNIGTILIIALAGLMIILVFFTVFKPMFSFLYARADGIFAVYIDQSRKGVHVFTYHLNPGSRYGGHRTRDIQHYYILLETGKIFYKLIFTHSMAPMAGRSGWTGFQSFEESVLRSPHLITSIEKLSVKTGVQLQLGQKIDPAEDNHFSFEINGMIAELKKFSNTTDEGIKIVFTDKVTKAISWQKKI